MRKAPAWLVERIAASCPDAACLWLGPPLSFPESVHVHAHPASEQAPPAPGAYGAAFVARAEGELSDVVRSVRSLLTDGARIELLLPQPGQGLRGTLGGFFGALGKVGRQPRSLETQCAALLAAGALDITVADHGRGRCFVYGRLPAAASPLDEVFAHG